MIGFALAVAALSSPPLAAQPPASAPASMPTPTSTPDQEEATIVVTATRSGRCRISLADRALSERRFDTLAGEWARLGRALRVVHPPNAPYSCLARIAFRLGKRGVRLVHFVEQGPGGELRGANLVWCPRNSSGIPSAEDAEPPIL
jgi:hypothetical protein